MTTSPLTEAGENLLGAVRAAVRVATVDQAAVQAALDEFATTTGITGANLEPVQAAAWEVVRRHKQGMDFRGHEAASRMAVQYMWKIAAAMDDLDAPFDRADDLDAAEQELAQREQAAKEALLHLEQAVQAGDVDAVMKLRGEVEVKHPRRIAEARTSVLQLQLEQVRARQSVAAGRADRTGNLREAAEQRHAKLTQQLAQAVEDVTLANLEAGAYREAATSGAAEVRQIEAELTALKTTHEQEMQARLRRVAGLPEPERQQEQGSTEVRIIGTVSRSGAHDFTPTTAGSY